MTNNRKLSFAGFCISLSFLVHAVASFSAAPALGAALGLGGKDKKKENEAREPLCFLFGDAMRNARESQGLSSLGNLIRLRFVAQTPEECMTQFELYCRKEILGKGHTVGKLNGFFEDSRHRADFSLGLDCSVRKTTMADERQQESGTASE